VQLHAAPAQHSTSAAARQLSAAAAAAAFSLLSLSLSKKKTLKTRSVQTVQLAHYTLNPLGGSVVTPDCSHKS
jgi:hypothetical protein